VAITMTVPVPEHPPTTGRIEAFSDGVVAIIITIMVLELKLPDGIFATQAPLAIAASVAPKLFSYALSFVVVGIMLINHHGLMREAPYATRALYWWNAHLLFWMSLIPFATAAMGDNPHSPYAVAFYGVILAFNGFAYALLHRSTSHLCVAAGQRALRNRASVTKDLISTLLYAAAIPLAFVSVYISDALYVAISAAYFLPNTD
jgi:uncharacterized membrane protein